MRQHSTIYRWKNDLFIKLLCMNFISNLANMSLTPSLYLLQLINYWILKLGNPLLNTLEVRNTFYNCIWYCEICVISEDIKPFFVLKIRGGKTSFELKTCCCFFFSFLEPKNSEISYNSKYHKSINFGRNRTGFFHVFIASSCDAGQHFSKYNLRELGIF